MQLSPLIILYKKEILKNNFKFDNIQYKTIKLLNKLYKNLSNYQKNKNSILKNLLKFLPKFMLHDVSKKKIRGIYLWGNPGCGKTWIINLFFQSIPKNRKLRFHIHAFLIYVHKKLKILQGQDNPLLIIANQFKLNTDILFLDELYILDISDAVLISTLIMKFFENDIILIITSNVPPNELYHKMLNNNFLVVIKKIKEKCDVIHMNSGIDYRNIHFNSICLWKFPLNNETYNYMHSMFYILSGNKLKKSSILRINYRNIEILGSNNGVLSIDFQSICATERNQNDYAKLSRLFHSILVHNIPIMMYNNENEARRFLSLVDELYENNIKLLVSAETNKHQIYQGTKLKFEYKRCLSRLQEMQSEKYFKSQKFGFTEK
ncbi:cell division protein ZapE [Candidatus Pantoea edessiphila]|uniref:Cell division protein ZapE n=1 Tax=Candidatus Pantoea edessiphila TaxID=2044610 RepID=A0A2P5T027_9GAMM|nr:cell division protein ZapE [Candidatus Pantoea edessiphila]PPI87913.1 cell division protein ZapE [Candidatus Pantoea edessiphila]